MSVQVKDWRGQTIKVGDTVVYPGRMGSSLWLNEGEVLEIDNSTPTPTFLIERLAQNQWDTPFKKVRVSSGYVTKVTDRGI